MFKQSTKLRGSRSRAGLCQPTEALSLSPTTPGRHRGPDPSSPAAVGPVGLKWRHRAVREQLAGAGDPRAGMRSGARAPGVAVAAGGSRLENSQALLCTASAGVLCGHPKISPSSRTFLKPVVTLLARSICHRGSRLSFQKNSSSFNFTPHLPN